MKGRKDMKTKTSSIYLALIVFAFACFALMQNAQAVSPPPDGGYAGGNTAEGQTALLSLTSGGYNTAIGFLSLRSNTIGSFNTAVGAGALLATVSDNPNTAKENTATGAGALLSNTIGFNNTATGALALISNTTGDHNTATGDEALLNNNNGFANTAIGSEALLNNSSGTFNIAIGFEAGGGITSATRVIAIGTSGANVSNSCYIGSIAGQTVGAGGSTCYVDNDGKLGVFLSARRFKTDIADMAAASEAILALHPVTFHYKPELDKLGIPQFGLVAEEVAKVNPDLVTHDAKGEISTVRYEAVNAMLLNEFLKEHRKVQEQQTTIAELKSTVAKQQKGLDTFTGRLEQQAAELQRVSAQLQLSKSVPQTVLNTQ